MREKIMTLSVAKDFSTYPAGRYESDGPFSGEGFLKQKLLPALEKAEKLKIILDGTMGYGSSFLEEAFGGLVRLQMWPLSSLLEKIEFVSDEEPGLIDEIIAYMKAEDKKLNVNQK